MNEDQIDTLAEELRKLERDRTVFRTVATSKHLIERLSALPRENLVELYNAVVQRLMVVE